MSIKRQELVSLPSPQSWNTGSKCLLAIPLVAALLGGIALGLYGPQAVGLEKCTVSQMCLLRGAGVLTVALSVNALYYIFAKELSAEGQAKADYQPWWTPVAKGVLSLTLASALIWSIGLGLYGPHAVGQPVDGLSTKTISLIHGGGALLFSLSAFAFHRLLSPPQPNHTVTWSE